MKRLAPESGLPIVDALDVEELPRGRVTKLFVQMATDGLGVPVRIPMMVARGVKEGPVFGLTAAVHGNELNGIPVIHRLFERLDCRTLRGSVVAAVVVNVPGYGMQQRSFHDGQDLNHIFPGRADGNCGQVYAARFLDRVLSQFNYLVDLHTASFGRVNSLYVRADLENPTAARMALLQRPQIIVHNPPSDRTLRGAASELGVPAITVEIGNPQRFHRDYIKRSLVGLRSVLAEVGMTAKRQERLGSQPVLCQRSFWTYTDRGGLLSVKPEVTDRVEKDQVVAELTDAFGDILREYRAPESGVVIGRSVNPVAPTGARILHIGLLADEQLQEKS